MKFPPQAWALRMDAQWELRFEQHKPFMEDQVIQINIGDNKNLKPIFMSKNLDQNELQSLIGLVREYMNAFA